MFQVTDDFYKLQFQNEQAKNALILFLQEIALYQKVTQSSYSSLNIPQEIKQPQVFFSYAWGEERDIKFKQLQVFLKMLQKDFEQAGITVWFDLSRMIGDVDTQMRNGIEESNLILLMGTELYAKKTTSQSKSNVKKELDFSLEKANKSSKCTLIPLVLESKNDRIFPELGYKYIFLDFTSWLNLKGKSHPVCNMENYIQALTSLQPLGLLPVALGFNKTDYNEFRQTLKKLYETAQTSLINRLKEIYEKSSKSSIIPVRHINFKDIQYNPQTDRLGQGSFGTVYKGEWNKLPVAVKEIHGTLNKEIEKAFNNEAEIMMRANNNWVVRLYGIAQELQKIALVMELMPKGSLNQLLHNGQELPWDLRYQIAQDIAHGLNLLHNDDILHRDLKSDNVLLDDRLRAKLSDFGLSKIKNSSRSTTKRTQAVGTEGWMAPELFLDIDELEDSVIPYSMYSDIYSYGMVLWEIATRKLPYEGHRPIQIEKFVKSGKRLAYPKEIIIPENFKLIVKGACEQKPEDRLSLPVLIERLKFLEIELKNPLQKQGVSQEGEQKAILNQFNKSTTTQTQRTVNLIECAKSNDLSGVSEALKNGVNINSIGAKGYTALHEAAFEGHLTVVQLLVEKGCNTNVADQRGWTPFHLAAWNGKLNIVKFLHNKINDINFQDNEGWAALHKAIRNGHIEVVSFLLSIGANCKLRTTMKGSETVEDIIKLYGRKEIGALIKSQDSNSKKSTFTA